MNIPPQFSTQNTGPHKPQHEENSPDNGRDDTPKRPPNPNPCAACSLPTVKSKCDMLHPWSADCCRRCAERGIMCVPKPKVQKERRTRRKPYDKSPENSKCEDPKAGSSSTSTATAVPERVQPQPLPRDDMAMAQSPTLSAGGSSGRGMVGAETSNFRGGIGSHHPSPPHAATLQPQFYQHVNGQFTASSSNTASASSLRSLDYTMSYEFPLESSPSSDAPAHRMGAQPEFVPNSATTLGDSFVWSSLGYPREL